MTNRETDGISCEILNPALPAGCSALFLDRDGTLIDLVDYLDDPERVVLIDSAVQAVQAANRENRAVVIVTNQSGIGRGYYDWASFDAVQARLYALLDEQGARIDAAYACSHPPPDAGGPEDSPYRKPAAGMLLRAAQDLSLDLATSVIAGDSASDLMAGKAAGLPQGVLVTTGYGEESAKTIEAAGIEGRDFGIRFGW